MEIVSFGDTCLRLRGREGIVATDAFPRIVGPTGRGLTADILTYSHPDGQQTLGLDRASAKRTTPARGGGPANGRTTRRVPTSLESAFLLDSPGEYEVHDVLITGVKHVPRRGAGRRARRSTRASSTSSMASTSSTWATSAIC